MKPRLYLDWNATTPLRAEARAAMIADSIGATFYQADSGPEAARLLAQEALHRRAPLAEQVRLQVLRKSLFVIDYQYSVHQGRLPNTARFPGLRSAALVRLEQASCQA